MNYEKISKIHFDQLKETSSVTESFKRKSYEYIVFYVWLYFEFYNFLHGIYNINW